jgi:hypothetical protein
VLAFAATAVPATMDGGGVLFETQDPRQVAHLMQAILSDADVEERVVAAQDAALDRLIGQDFDGMVVRFVERVASGERRPLPRVAYDFWRQFRLAEELEAIRQVRPSAFRALPAAPEDAAPVADLGHRA